MNKFFSRKFIVCLLGVISGIAVSFLSQGNTTNQIIGSCLSIICAVAYMIVEGAIDAKNVAKITDNAVNIMEKSGASDKAVEFVDKVGEALAESMESVTKEDGDN